MRFVSALFGFALVAAACTDLSGLSAADDGVDAGKILRDSSAPTDASGAADIGTPTVAACDVSKPFTPPELVTAFDPTDNYVKGAILSVDELEAFYLRYNGTNWDLRHARRAQTTDEWGGIETLAITPSPDASLSLTAAGLKLYYWEIGNNYRMTRTSTTAPFGTPSKFDVASGPMAFIVTADDTAYFSKYEGDAASDKVIKRATVNTNGFSFTSTTVPDIHVASTTDSNPILNASETAMYYASNRNGGKGLADIWVTRRASKQVEFGSPVNVPELSTDEPDAITWVSNDECRVFLDRASHVYRASRPR